MQRYLWLLISFVLGVLSPPILIWRILSTSQLTGRVDGPAVIAFAVVALLALAAAVKLSRCTPGFSFVVYSCVLVIGAVLQLGPPALFGWVGEQVPIALGLWSVSCFATSVILLSPLIPVSSRNSSLIAAFLFLAGAAVIGLNSFEVDGLTGEGRVSFRRATRTVQPAVSDAVKDTPADTLVVTPGETGAVVGPAKSTRVLWQQFSDFASESRGRKNRGLGDRLPDHWWQSMHVRWTVPVGKGWSGVACTDERIFTQEQLEGQDQVTCRSMENGTLIWSVPHHAPPYRSPYGGDGPRSTPAICELIQEDGTTQNAVIAVGPNESVLCLNLDNGNERWNFDLSGLGSGEPLPHGLSCSPLIAGNLAIVSCSRSKAPCLLALNVLDGSRVWEVASDWKASYSSPILLELCGVPQIVFHAGPGVMGVSPEDGKVLWQFEWSNEHQTNASIPVVIDAQNGVLAISSGYGTGVAEIKVMPKESDPWDVSVLWTSKDLSTKFSSCTLYEDQLVGLDNGILAALDRSTGRRLWKKGRYRFGQNLMVDEKVVVLSEDGELVILNLSPRGPEELVRLPVIEGKCWSSPVVADRSFIIRNDENMVRLSTSTN